MKTMTTVALLVAFLAVTAHAYDMRGLKKKNKAYLEKTEQKLHVPFNSEQYMHSMGKPTRRSLLAKDMEVTSDNIDHAGRQLMQANNITEPQWVEGVAWNDPTVGISAQDDCIEDVRLYGPWGTSYICPKQTQVDCGTEAYDFAQMDDAGSPVLPAPAGSWNKFPSALRGNWDEPDYWTIPFPMGKWIVDYENMCENGEVFNTVRHPSCIPKGVDFPFATLCVFNRLYTLDYNVLWYMWFSWIDYSDSAELITRSANIATDGMDSTTALYQARFFIPEYVPVGSRKLQQDGSNTNETPVLASAAKGGDIETLQNLLDTTGLGGAPTLVFPPPVPPPPTPWAPGNNTNATAA